MKAVKKRKRSTGNARLAGRFFRVLLSFRVRKLALDVDTGNYMGNAFLHPLFYFLSGPNRVLAVNYRGRNRAEVEVRNRLGRMLVAFLRTS
jgi:hypothetical protein